MFSHSHYSNDAAKNSISLCYSCTKDILQSGGGGGQPRILNSCILRVGGISEMPSC